MRKKPHINIYLKINPYDSFNYFCMKLGEALTRCGAIIKWVDADTRAPLGIDPQRTAFTLSFVLLVMQNGQMLWEATQLPHLCLLTDPIAWNIGSIKGKNLYLGCVDQFECDFARSIHFPQQVAFIPHAVDKEISYQEMGTRPYEVVFCGACYDHQTILKKIQVRFTGKLRDAIFHAIALAEVQPLTSIYTLLRISLESYGIPPTIEVIQKIHRYVDSYIRAKDRVELIRAIHDVPVHVFGGTALDDEPQLPLQGWSSYLRDKPNVVIHPAVSFEQSLEIFKQSRIVLNSSPFFRNGSHERIINALACGAVPLTNESLWVKEYFVPMEELIVYSPDRKEVVNGLLQELLSDETKRLSIVHRGRKKVLGEHTWDNRAKQILDFMENQIQ